MEFQEDAGFPFNGMKQLNAISVNKDAVKMSKRLANDFYDNETQDPSKPKPRSKTQYEIYSRTCFNRTKGFF